MNLILAIYLIVLSTFTFFIERCKDRKPIRRAWLWFVVAIFLQGLIPFIQAFTFGLGDWRLILVTGGFWGVLGMSFYSLSKLSK